MTARSLAAFLIAVLASAFLGLVIGGCADEPQEVKTVTVERQVTGDPSAPKRRQRPKPLPLAPSRTTPAEAFVNCDPNIQAKAETTTCPFAQNAFWSYWTSGESSSPLQVWSPAAHASFAATCESDGPRVSCTTSNNAAVTFSQAAVDLYSQAQADSYAAGHDLGPDPYEDPPDDGSSPDYGGQDGGSAGDCQGYDPCIPPGGDVDCRGGSGNGPRYVDGPVDVYGSDPYGLDADGDGIGCDP
jgi:hypothetical protein